MSRVECTIFYSRVQSRNITVHYPFPKNGVPTTSCGAKIGQHDTEFLPKETNDAGHLKRKKVKNIRAHSF